MYLKSFLRCIFKILFNVIFMLRLKKKLRSTAIHSKKKLNHFQVNLQKSTTWLLTKFSDTILIYYYRKYVTTKTNFFGKVVK